MRTRSLKSEVGDFTMQRVEPLSRVLFADASSIYVPHLSHTHCAKTLFIANTHGDNNKHRAKKKLRQWVA